MPKLVHRMVAILLTLISFGAASAQERLQTRWFAPAGREYRHVRVEPTNSAFLHFERGAPGSVILREGNNGVPVWQYTASAVASAVFDYDTRFILISLPNRIVRASRIDGQVVGTFSSTEYGSIYQLNNPAKEFLVARIGVPLRVISSSGTFVRSIAITPANADELEQIKINYGATTVAVQGKIASLATWQVKFTYATNGFFEFAPNGTGYLIQKATNRVSMYSLADNSLIWEQHYKEPKGDNGNPITYITWTLEPFSAPGSPGADVIYVCGEESRDYYDIDGNQYLSGLACIYRIYVSDGRLEQADILDRWFEFRSAYSGPVNWVGGNHGRVLFSYTSDDTEIRRDYSLELVSPKLMQFLPTDVIPASTPGESKVGAIATPVPLPGQEPSINAILAYIYLRTYEQKRATGEYVRTVKHGDSSNFDPSALIDRVGYSPDGKLMAMAGFGNTFLTRNGQPGVTSAPLSLVGLPVFIGNQLLAIREFSPPTEPRKPLAIHPVSNAGNNPEMLFRTEHRSVVGVPIAGRRDGLGFATIENRVFRYYDVSFEAGVVRANYKVSFPTSPVSGASSYQTWAVTTSNDQFVVVTVARTSSQVHVQSSMFDVRSTPARLLSTRTLRSYGSKLSTGRVEVALSRDGSQCAVLLSALTPGADGTGVESQIDFFRISDGVGFCGFTNQFGGLGFQSVSYTTDSRTLAVLHQDGGIVAIAVPPQLVGFTAPATAATNQSVSVTVQLRGSARPQGDRLFISFPDGGLSGESSVTVPSGASSITFPVNTTNATGTFRIRVRLHQDQSDYRLTVK